MSAHSLRVGVAQIDCTLGDLHANVERHRAWIVHARAQGVRLLVFPELSLTGYAIGARVPELALAAHSNTLVELARLAPDMAVVVGFVEEGHAAQFYNAAALLAGGRVKLVHRKLNLPSYGKLDEGKRFAKGQQLHTCRLQDGSPWHLGMLVCADLWNPALVHLAMLQGTTCLLAPVASAVEAVGGQFSNPQGWSLALSFYAMVYGTPVVMANRVGVEGDAHFWGGSRIVDADGQVLAQAGDGEELIHAELDPERLRQARFRLPTLRDADSALVQRELGRCLERPPLA